MEGYTLTELWDEVDAELLLVIACNSSIRSTHQGLAERADSSRHFRPQTQCLLPG